MIIYNEFFIWEEWFNNKKYEKMEYNLKECLK